MHQQGKNPGILLPYTIKNHHGDDSKMPRTGSIGSRNNHRYTTHYKHDQCCNHP